MQDHNTSPRRRLSDILSGGADSLRNQWDKTAVAKEFAPLPAGTYTARIIAGELFTSRTNSTPGYKLTFKVLDGEHTGRQFWHDSWLTGAALPMTKRDLAKLGVTSIEQLELPLPPGIRCQVKLVLRKDDNGTEYNRVRSFEVVGIDADATVDADFPPGVAEVADRLLREERDADTAKPEADTSPSASAPPILDAVTTPPAREYDPDEAGGDTTFDPAQIEADDAAEGGVP